MTTKSDGSTASYYELPAGAKELQDLISYKNMNSQVGESFRSLYRYGESSHSDRERDCKKVIFYMEAELKRLADPWVSDPHTEKVVSEWFKEEAFPPIPPAKAVMERFYNIVDKPVYETTARDGVAYRQMRASVSDTCRGCAFKDTDEVGNEECSTDWEGAQCQSNDTIWVRA